MDRRFLLCSLLASMWGTESYGQQRILNPDHTLKPGHHRIAFLPVNNGDPEAMDSLFVKYFDEHLVDLEMAGPATVRMSIMANAALQLMIERVQQKSYTKKELKSYPGLSQLLTGAELESMRSGLEGADLMWMPLAFGTKASAAMPGYTFGEAAFRLYDLSTGAFILECRAQLNVNAGGGAGGAMLTEALLSMMHDDYVKNFLKRNGLL